MPIPFARAPRRRLLLKLALLLLVLAVLVVGREWRWLDLLRLSWQECRTEPAARAAGVWLPDYRLALEVELAGLEEDETSGLTWNPQTGTLFTVTGKHPQLVEISPEGAVLRRIRLTGFSDPEGVEALGDGRLAIVDERRRLLALFRLPPGADSFDLADAQRVDLGFAAAGNKGFEGLGWDARTNRLLLALERPPALFGLAVSAEGAAGELQPLPGEGLPVRDLSSLTVDPRSGHFLLLSDESRLLVEFDREGRPLSFISLLGGFNGLGRGIKQAEGVAMDAAGNLYVVGEPNRFHVFRKTHP
ncbi:DNA-binding protein [Azotobacter chroococcum]|uniref:SdiA-regulated domain-containing protein n=1 Tax=Azotobacter chroococcum TaxID=353 RepID=UPI00103FB92C|nr:SdiA-regulated domain-containing protein [Azotobacter chroococcum]TBW03972.1 DNA-binding protein [Azotobacter chroococcum]TBW40596.1 DNA-binding protein [Azotobacter chroococcum]